MKDKFWIKKIFDLWLTENRICRKYRKDIFKKISHLTFSEKRDVLNMVDQEFLNRLEVMVFQPRKSTYINHHDRFYLSTRFDCIDEVLRRINARKKGNYIKKRRASIKLVSFTKKVGDGIPTNLLETDNEINDLTVKKLNNEGNDDNK